MSSHSEGSQPGRVLCDELRDHLHALWGERGGVSRKEAKKVCSIGIAGGPKTTYVYHRKTKPGVRIYIDGDSSSPPHELPTEIRLHVRPRFQSAWERRFPFFFDLEDPVLIPDIAARLAGRTSIAAVEGKAWRDETLPAEEVSQTDVWEGAVKKVSVNVYERSRTARTTCLRRWGSTCVICNFDFGAVYGDEFSGFIHVHHVVPVSAVGQRYKLDPVNDLRPVCPNCHAVIHRRDPAMSVDEAKALLVGRGAAEQGVAADGAARRR